MTSSAVHPLEWQPIPSSLGGRFKASVSRALAHEGVALVEPRDGDPDGPALVLLGDLGATACETVQRLSAGGERRITVALAPTLAVNSEIGWKLIALGASEVMAMDTLIARPGALAARLQRWQDIDAVLASKLVREQLIGISRAWTTLLRQVVEVALFTTAGVLLWGESGTGKELLARLIHTLDPRPDKQELIVVDCTTVASELAGSEFFGHERGAFTNAHASREGAFALANRGTMFLDEVGELSAGMQAQLLRVVQEKTYKRVGSNAWQRTEFRLVCATNRDLWADVFAGGFRRDLYYRLAGWVIRVPSLEERREDVLPLARHFLAVVRPPVKTTEFDPAVSDYLARRHYPGNIRDLRQLVTRIAARHVGDGPISYADIPEDDRPAAPLPSLPWPDLEFERSVARAIALGLGLKEIGRITSDVAVRLAIKGNGNLHDAARSLGVTDRALQMRQANNRRDASGSPRRPGARALNGTPVGEPLRGIGDDMRRA